MGCGLSTGNSKPYHGEPYTLTLQNNLTDWHDRTIPKEMRNFLIPGCIVRVNVQYPNMSTEDVFVQIYRVDGGLFWATTTSLWRVIDMDMPDALLNGLLTGQVLSFRKRHVKTIPLGKEWQPKAYLHNVKHLELQIMENSASTSKIVGQGYHPNIQTQPT